MGSLNENRSSYRVSYYDINIDFNIDKKSLNGFVTIKAESMRDLNILQIDLAENLDIKKIMHKKEELNFSRELDAVLVNFPSTIKKGNFFEFSVFYEGIPQSADNPPHGQEVLLGLKIKMAEIGLLILVKEKVQEFGGQIRIILQLREIA